MGQRYRTVPGPADHGLGGHERIDDGLLDPGGALQKSAWVPPAGILPILYGVRWYT